ncbi:MAG: transposase zinc-binding domain-containing protein [Firmicutes bacterium]|nr:transposase zinc-binding domain-containing protein [Bacillota bacterium]
MANKLKAVAAITMIMALVCAAVSSGLFVGRTGSVFADSYAPMTPYSVEFEDGDKVFYMYGESQSAQSGLYYSTGENIYLINTAEPDGSFFYYMYESDLTFSSDGMSFTHTPWTSLSSGWFGGGLAIQFYNSGKIIKEYYVYNLVQKWYTLSYSVSHLMWEDWEVRSFDEATGILSMTTLDGRTYLLDITTGLTVEGSAEILKPEGCPECNSPFCAEHKLCGICGRLDCGFSHGNYIYTEYTVSVTGGTADAEFVITGEKITLTPMEPPEGKRFKEWRVVSGGVTIEGNVFIVGEEDIEIVAVWEDEPPVIQGCSFCGSLECGGHEFCPECNSMDFACGHGACPHCGLYGEHDCDGDSGGNGENDGKNDDRKPGCTSFGCASLADGGGTFGIIGLLLVGVAIQIGIRKKLPTPPCPHNSAVKRFTKNFLVISLRVEKQEEG